MISPFPRQIEIPGGSRMVTVKVIWLLAEYQKASLLVPFLRRN
jgi:hypothetical protein